MGRSRASTRLSSSNNNKDPKPSQQDLINDASSLVSSASDDKLSEDALNQVDQFLREALQNPRERLSRGVNKQNVPKPQKSMWEQILHTLVQLDNCPVISKEISNRLMLVIGKVGSTSERLVLFVLVVSSKWSKFVRWQLLVLLET
uniref:uncharacterized protein LOC101300576 isoform X4 n=1 Tax=Fragaria vesca subsp. vesca TaxID=101020 RepID=UPI0005CADD4F|nr:PREDICTED: uncharacterized protein LOC101300576 isoform X4 [Fragaria vesca subsp. vesca]